MIINALSNVGRTYEDTRNVTLILTSLITFIFIINVSNPVTVLYLWIFTGGLAIGTFIMQRYVAPPSFWIFGFLLKLKYKPYKIGPHQTVKFAQCPVCEKTNCRRHDVKVKSDTVWKGIELPKNVDDKIEEFCDLILINYIHFWYYPISKDQDLIHEIKCLFRYITASLIRIAVELDVGEIVIEKIIPLGVVHLDKYVKTKAKYPQLTGDALAEKTLEELGDNLHVALRNEETERRYLKSLVEILLPFLVPENRLTSPKAVCFIRELVSSVMVQMAVDLVAAPDFINLMIVMLMDPESMKEWKKAPSPKVELLQSFIDKSSPTQGSNYYTLEELLTNPNNLFSFMQFLKSQGVINLLQCCLTAREKIEIFEKDENASELKYTGYKNEMRAFYDLYFAADASDLIEFPAVITLELKNALLAKYYSGQNPFHKVLRRIYNFLTSHLQKNYCVHYYQSDEFYLLLLGARVMPPPKLNSWAKTSVKTTAIGSMFSTLKEKLSANPMDPMMDVVDDSGIANNLSAVANATTHAIGLCEAEGKEEPEDNSIDYNQRNNIELNKWSVEITNSELQGEWLRQYVVYVITVHTHPDRSNKDYQEMVVKRRFSEFVILHKRLRRFHGSMGGLQLPQKKNINALSGEFITYRRKELNIYLQRIIRNDALRQSELIAKFLSPKCDDFTRTGIIAMPKHALGSAGEMAGKMMSAARTREKNLYLFPFLKSVCKSVTPGYYVTSSDTMSNASAMSVASTPVTTPTPTRKNEPKLEESPLAQSPSAHLKQTALEAAKVLQAQNKVGKMKNLQFVELDRRRQHESKVYVQLVGVTECVIWSVLLLGDLPSIVIHALCAILLVIKNTLDSFVKAFINFKIRLVVQEKEIIEIIELARDILFFDTEVRGQAEWDGRAARAKTDLMTKVPRPIKKLIGVKRLDNALLTVYQGVQNHRLNKQLIYTLLDSFLSETLVELKEKEDFSLADQVASDPSED